jgi:WD40 repeat protein
MSMQQTHTFTSPQQETVPLPNWVFALSWNPDSNRLATAHMDFAVRVWDLRYPPADNPTQTLHHKKFAVGVGFDPQGRFLASSDAHTNDIYLWDIKQGTQAAVLQEHIGWPYGIAWGPGGGLLATCGADGRVLLWDAATQHLKRTLWQFRNQDERGIGFHSLAWSPDGGKLIAISTEGLLYLWETSGWKLRVFQIPQMNRLDAALAWSPDGQRIALLPSTGDLLIVDVAARPRILTMLDCPLPDANNERFRGVDWSRDGVRIAATRGSNEILVYDRGMPQPSVYADMVECTALAWSPDNSMLAVGDNDGSIFIWQ